MSALKGYSKEGDRCYIHMSDTPDQSSTCNFPNAQCCYIKDIEMDKMRTTKLCVDMTKKTVTRVYPKNKEGDAPKPETYEFDCSYTPPPPSEEGALKTGVSMVFAVASSVYMLY